jgi:hypothetical protein
MESITLKTKLPRKWALWYHHDKDNWKVTGFKKIYIIETPEDYWQLYNNWDKINDGINQKHFFLMQNGISPIWEDPENKNGGCWSFKIHSSQSQDLWDDLSTYLVTENLSLKANYITGLSICLKKNNYSVVKIWNKNSKENSLSLLNEKILKKWGMDIIYIAHIAEN